MSWSDLHGESERLAEAAHDAMRSGHIDEASNLFAQAAMAEADALASLTSDKPRTYGITAVSAVALWYKAGELAQAEHFAHKVASTSFLPAFAVDQIRSLLQSIWNQQAQREAGVSFAPGQVIISVKGGDVVRGGAPLDLILEKAQAIENIFYRVVECLKDMPLRRRGPPSRELQQRCRPWLFQSVPGSYQFSVALQKPPQGELFDDTYPAPEVITDKFLHILQAASEEPDSGLQSLVPSNEYRETFLKMTRNLAPTGKSFGEIEIKVIGDRQSVVLRPSSRKLISDTLRRPVSDSARDSAKTEELLHGVLRALDLDNDWLEVSIDGKAVKVKGVGETVDDVIGPMVNHNVVVRVARKRGGLSFVDIEQEE